MKMARLHCSVEQVLSALGPTSLERLWSATHSRPESNLLVLDNNIVMIFWRIGAAVLRAITLLRDRVHVMDLVPCSICHDGKSWGFIKEGRDTAKQEGPKTRTQNLERDFRKRGDQQLYNLCRPNL